MSKKQKDFKIQTAKFEVQMLPGDEFIVDPGNLGDEPTLRDVLLEAGFNEDEFSKVKTLVDGAVADYDDVVKPGQAIMICANLTAG